MKQHQQPIVMICVCCCCCCFYYSSHWYYLPTCIVFLLLLSLSCLASLPKLTAKMSNGQFDFLALTFSRVGSVRAHTRAAFGPKCNIYLSIRKYVYKYIWTFGHRLSVSNSLAVWIDGLSLLLLRSLLSRLPLRLQLLCNAMSCHDSGNMRCHRPSMAANNNTQAHIRHMRLERLLIAAYEQWTARLLY